MGWEMNNSGDLLGGGKGGSETQVLTLSPEMDCTCGLGPRFFSICKLRNLTNLQSPLHL